MVMFKTIQLELFFGFLLTLSGIAVAFLSWPSTQLAANLFVSPSVTFGDRAPPLVLRATSPVSGESVLKGSHPLLFIIPLATPHGKWYNSMYNYSIIQYIFKGGSPPWT